MTTNGAYKLIDDSVEQLGCEFVRNAHASIRSICDRHSTIFLELSNCKGQIQQLNAIAQNSNFVLTDVETKALDKSLRKLSFLVSNFCAASQTLKELSILISQLVFFIESKSK